MKLAPLLVVFAIAIPFMGSAKAVETVDLSADGYRFEGWGVSLCWWAHQVGDWPEDRLESLAEAIVDPTEGLGLSLFRYNIGGGDAPGHDHLRAGGDVPGFQAGPNTPIDPDADRNQRRVMLALRDRVRLAGHTPILEAFSNSPPHWMTASGCASGGKDGAPNLPPERVDDFAAYLADVVELYRERYGVEFRTIDPFNEPNAKWWTAGHNQEGCQVPTAQQAGVIAALHRAFEERGLGGMTAISATDGHSIDWTLENVRALDPATLRRLGQINTHTYAGTKRRELREFAAGTGKRLWQSESGPMNLDQRGYGALVAMMGRIALDLNELRPAAWCLWQAVSDSDAWGCFLMDESEHTFRPSKSHRLYAQFTRAIRPGDRILPTDGRVNLLAAISSDRRRATIVVVNDQAEPQTREVRLENAEVMIDQIAATRSSRSERFASVEATAYTDGVLRIEAPPHSVTTVTVPLREAE